MTCTWRTPYTPDIILSVLHPCVSSFSSNSPCHSLPYFSFMANSFSIHTKSLSTPETTKINPDGVITTASRKPSSSTASTMDLGSPTTRHTPKRSRTATSSPPSSYSHASSHHYRPTSRSTAHSNLTSRRSSRHSSPRRVPTSASLTPSVRSASRRPPGQKRESLLALHRESCRLFQVPGQEVLSPPPVSTKMSVQHISSAASSDIGSPPLSPGLYAQSSISDRSLDHGRPSTIYLIPAEPPCKEPSNTVNTAIDWTSPSTRRREYAKIDRASHGVRGLWRKVAPRWCQSRNDRMPFFEPDKNGKANYEGSVRRFRMDLPDEPELARSRRGGFRLGGRRHTAV